MLSELGGRAQQDPAGTLPVAGPQGWVKRPRAAELWARPQGSHDLGQGAG